jgi:hypothetical protein
MVRSDLVALVIVAALAGVIGYWVSVPLVGLFLVGVFCLFLVTRAPRG